MSEELTRIQLQTGVFQRKAADREKVEKLNEQIATAKQCVDWSPDALDVFTSVAHTTVRLSRACNATGRLWGT